MFEYASNPKKLALNNDCEFAAKLKNGKYVILQGLIVEIKRKTTQMSIVPDHHSRQYNSNAKGMSYIKGAIVRVERVLLTDGRMLHLEIFDHQHIEMLPPDSRTGSLEIYVPYGYFKKVCASYKLKMIEVGNMVSFVTDVDTLKSGVTVTQLECFTLKILDIIYRCNELLYICRIVKRTSFGQYDPIRNFRYKFRDYEDWFIEDAVEQHFYYGIVLISKSTLERRAREGFYKTLKAQTKACLPPFRVKLSPEASRMKTSWKKNQLQTFTFKKNGSWKKSTQDESIDTLLRLAYRGISDFPNMSINDILKKLNKSHSKILKHVLRNSKVYELVKDLD